MHHLPQAGDAFFVMIHCLKGIFVNENHDAFVASLKPGVNHYRL